jgi:hypothetical protein
MMSEKISKKHRKSAQPETLNSNRLEMAASLNEGIKKALKRLNDILTGA